MPRDLDWKRLSSKSNVPGAPLWDNARHRDAGRKAYWPPRPSICRRCELRDGNDKSAPPPIFNRNPWARDRSEGCERCGADRGAYESPSYHDWTWVPRPGRPVKGPQERDLIYAELGKALLEPVVRDMIGDLFAREEAGGELNWRKELELLCGVLQALSPSVTSRALEKVTGISKSRLHRMTKLGQKSLDNVKESEMKLAQIPADVREMRDDIHVIREYFTTPAEEAEHILNEHEQEAETIDESH